MFDLLLMVMMEVKEFLAMTKRCLMKCLGFTYQVWFTYGKCLCHLMFLSSNESMRGSGGLKRFS